MASDETIGSFICAKSEPRPSRVINARFSHLFGLKCSSWRKITKVLCDKVAGRAPNLKSIRIRSVAGPRQAVHSMFRKAARGRSASQGRRAGPIA
jgi:hypothetical protein